MPVYVVNCEVCGEQELFARMSDAGTFMPCSVCSGMRPQTVRAPNFTEDRVRFFRGVNGSKHSFALGTDMPDSRQARDRMARERGIEFMSLKEHLAENKEASEAWDYKKHVDSGGDRALDKPPVDTSSLFKEKPQWAKDLGV